MTRCGAAGAIAALVVCFGTASVASAQRRFTREAPRSGSWEIGGGVTWTGAVDGPDRAAELTRNGSDSGGFDLFTASGRLENGAGAGATLAYYLTSALAIEGGFRYSKPRLTFRLSGDAEEAEPVTAEETLTRYVFSGSIVLHLRGMRIGRRTIPFIAAGAGHVRDLHENEQLIETGTQYHGVAGVKHWFGDGARRLGIRAEGGFAVTDGGVDFRDQSRTLPIAAASLVYLF